MLRTRIAVDIDEVLCPFFHPMAKRVGKTPPKKPHPYLYSKALGITEDQSRVMVSEFYQSEEFKKLIPFKHAAYALYQLKGRDYSIYAVTGRQGEAREGTEDWLNEHFSGVFDDLVLTNSFTNNEVPKSKLCLALNISSIIDDSFQTCVDCHGKGIEAIHFVGEPLYPWCHERHPAINTASNWLEVLNEFPSPWISNSPSDCSDTDPMCLTPDDPNRTPLLPSRRRTQVEPPW